MSYFGLHLQTPVDEWDSEILHAAEEGKPYKIAKFLWVEAGKIIKQLSPTTTTVFRHHIEHQQPFLDRAFISNAEADAAADEFILMFKDSVNQHGNVDYVESLNETYPSADLLAQAKAVSFDRAFIRRLPLHCPATLPVVYTAPPGNIDHDEYGVLVDLARECEAADGAFGYHNYWSVTNKHSWVNSVGHAIDYHMRWADSLDTYLLSRGIRVKYMLGESGPIGAGPAGYWQKPNDGWLHREVWDGDVGGYLSDLAAMDALYEDSHAGREGRLLGATLFTSGQPFVGWEYFQIRMPFLGDLTDYVIGSNSGPVDPPPSDNFKEEAWRITSEMQRTGQNGIRLNADAAIQKAIKQDNKTFHTDFQIVTSETTVQGKAVQAAESHSGSWPRRVYVWEAGKTIYWYNQ